MILGLPDQKALAPVLELGMASQLRMAKLPMERSQKVKERAKAHKVRGTAKARRGQQVRNCLPILLACSQVALELPARRLEACMAKVLVQGPERWQGTLVHSRDRQCRSTAETTAPASCNWGP